MATPFYETEWFNRAGQLNAEDRLAFWDAVHAWASGEPKREPKGPARRPYRLAIARLTEERAHRRAVSEARARAGRAGGISSAVSRARSSGRPAPGEDPEKAAEAAPAAEACEPEEPGTTASVRELPVIKIPLNKGNYGITRENLETFESLYPAVDVMQELRGMVAWCYANPTRKKTRDGVLNFITHWLSKAQDKAGWRFRAPRTVPDNPYSPFVKGGALDDL